MMYSFSVNISFLFKNSIIEVPRATEGTVVAYQTEELKCFDHLISSLCLGQILIILWKFRYKSYSINFVKAVKPFTTFQPLSTHIVHLKIDIVDAVLLHDHLCCTDTCQKNILCTWTTISSPAINSANG